MAKGSINSAVDWEYCSLMPKIAQKSSRAKDFSIEVRRWHMFHVATIRNVAGWLNGTSPARGTLH